MNELRSLTEGLAVLLIDGRSGSGKTYLAKQLAESGAQLLHLDLLYPGWGGLAEGSESVVSALDLGRYQRYDWAAGAFEDEWTELDLTTPLIVEGCGALTVANQAAALRWAQRVAERQAKVWSAAGRPSATVEAVVKTLWLECDDRLRRERALARDGDIFAPHWDEWAAQELAHFAAHKPWEFADQVCKISA
ncbi:hypothetical protein QBL02_06715 [Leucobacter sp. UT-8R-CII-1-4]|uniref:hypothetical protein n=1 Tax=Leucobacter sp. UT-8R-CII-1-4 TaxID=3040075 RepID=UPI0024A8039F|nr:hypothetical protein [Leucobacter sp. UT-8R-CII-1-4]MDI6023234.1 hypothetical protein [Leucobacter sp. UT-8R-CII-1-4]